MNGNSDLYGVQHGDLYGDRDDERVIEEFLKAQGLATHGTGIAKVMRAVAVLLQREAPADPMRCTCGTPHGRCWRSGRMIEYSGWRQVRCEEHTPQGAIVVP